MLTQCVFSVLFQDKMKAKFSNDRFGFIGLLLIQFSIGKEPFAIIILFLMIGIVSGSYDNSVYFLVDYC